MKLLLFDIDGTMLHANGVGRTAVERALARVCGRPITTTGVAFSGKTDPQIIDEILRANGFASAGASPLLDEALAAYEETAHEVFDPHSINRLPGVRSLLTRLDADPRVRLGLLTGNVESMAYRKLAAVALDHHFPFGAFGSDHAARHRLPPIAVARARTHTGRSFAGRNVVIIGDTAHDIRCGQGIDAFSVGVCTGRYGRHDLAAHTPDLLLDDLSDVDGFVRAVLEAA